MNRIFKLVFNLSLIILCINSDTNKKKSIFESSICESLPQFTDETRDEIENLRNDALRILDYVVNEQDRTYDELSYFVGKFGPRLAGSQNLEEAIDFMINMKSEEHGNVHTEDALVRHWV
jgi:carboxypeptidase Q